MELPKNSEAVTLPWKVMKPLKRTSLNLNIY